MLKVNHLNVQYGSKPVLRDVSFELQAGQMLAVIGPNGAGKSTLVRSISGIVAPTSGQIAYDGLDLAKLPSQERARIVSVVPQARSLPDMFTAWQVVQLGRTPYLNWFGQLTAHDDEIIRQAMLRTHTLDLANRQVGELSGGEQQRLLLARALVQSTPLLLLDEPTTHLDLQYQIHLLELICELVKNPLPEDALFPHNPPAVLVVLHDLNLVSRFADLVLLLVEGLVAAQGTKDEVLRPQVLSPAYGIPLEVHNLAGSSATVILPA